MAIHISSEELCFATSFKEMTWLFPADGFESPGSNSSEFLLCGLEGGLMLAMELMGETEMVGAAVKEGMVSMEGEEEGGVESGEGAVEERLVGFGVCGLFWMAVGWIEG